MLDWRGSGTILVVDDEDHVRNVTEMMLTQFGLDVLGAADGIEAVDVIRDRGDSIDLVIMDLTMPRMSGEEAFHEMRILRPDLKVVMTSGYNEMDTSSGLGKQDVFEFLQKPFDLENLISTVRRAVEGS